MDEPNKKEKAMRDATSLLLDLMNLTPSPIVDVIRTVEGHYVGRVAGDIGYNAFLGRPNTKEGPGRQRSREVWGSLSEEQKDAVRVRAKHPLDGEPIPLSDFGIVEDNQ